MSRLSDLLRQLEGKDSQLAVDLKREFEALSKRRAFGLNFERHVPETVELPGDRYAAVIRSASCRSAASLRATSIAGSGA